MLGQQATDFELPNQDGQTIRLSDFRGQKVILFAFPKAGTPGCNAQACNFRDEFFTIRSANAVVLGISPDSVEQLRQWKLDKNLPYDLLSDSDHTVLKAWGAWGISLLSVIRIPMVNRSFWVIDENGVVIAEQINVSPHESVRKALAAVGEVTPMG